MAVAIGRWVARPEARPKGVVRRQQPRPSLGARACHPTLRACHPAVGQVANLPLDSGFACTGRLATCPTTMVAIRLRRLPPARFQPVDQQGGQARKQARCAGSGTAAMPAL